jgi:hypothetical protein
VRSFCSSSSLEQLLLLLLERSKQRNSKLRYFYTDFGDYSQTTAIDLFLLITSDLPACSEASLNAIEPLLQATDQSTSSIINPSSGPVRSSHSPI